MSGLGGKAGASVSAVSAAVSRGWDNSENCPVVEQSDRTLASQGRTVTKAAVLLGSFILGSTDHKNLPRMIWKLLENVDV